jgi:hypothetical protein
MEKKRILNWQRRAEEKRRAEEEERRAELERMQKNAHLDALRERNIENIVERRSAQEEELLKKEKERQLIKEVKTHLYFSVVYLMMLSVKPFLPCERCSSSRRLVRDAS